MLPYNTVGYAPPAAVETRETVIGFIGNFTGFKGGRKLLRGIPHFLNSNFL
ncbi:hypothetical protein GCM10023310_22540 [Paenibacillus vulneris]